MNDNALSTKKVIMILFGLIIFMGLIIGWSIYKSGQNKYGDAITINNLSTYTKGKPSNKKSVDYIENDLLKTVNKNLKSPIHGKSVKDAVIRDGTFSQNFDNSKGVYTVTFIVDIASIKQSYNISYQWVEPGKPAGNVDEWGTAVTCLSKDKLLYGDFGCTDMFSQLNGKHDVLWDHLPYSNPEVTIAYKGDNEKDLLITIQTTAVDEHTDPNAAIANYKKEATDWISSVGANPSNYNITYNIIRASIY